MSTPSHNSRLDQAGLLEAMRGPGLPSLLDRQAGPTSTSRYIPDEQLVHTIAVAKGFARRAAHDFNNVMAVIHGFANILHNRLQGDEANLGIAEQIEASALEALKLTNWLSTFGNYRPVEMAQLDFNKVVGECLASLGKEKPAHVDLEVELAPEPLLMAGDESQLEEVCRELWSNAVEAMPQGGRVWCQTAIQRGPLHLSSGEEVGGPDAWVHLRVRDTGVGMDLDTQRAMFEPFFSTKSGKGRGLGLTMVYDAVGAHQGFIDVSSGPGAGTCVDVYFPAQASESTGQQQPSQSTAEKMPARLLVVDDEEMILEMVAQMLRGQDWEVIGVTSGEAALDAYRQADGEITAVILDMTLPGMNGLEAFQELKKLNSRVKVIVSTGNPHQQAVNDIMAQGAFGLLSKPFLAGHLTEVVNQARS